MADLVRTIIEGMLPDLTSLGRKKIFTKQEIRQIVQAREKAEYVFMRKNVTKKDYLKAINYELDLEKQRREKVKELKLKKQSQKDFSIIRRIIYIFDRLTSKYRYDIEIWKEYLYFCYRVKSTRMYFKAISRALELNPFSIALVNEDVWLLGVYYQFEVNNNPFRARKMFLRGIQLNGNAKEFWREYFKFELRFLDRIKARQNIIAKTKVNGEKDKEEDKDELVIEDDEALEIDDAEEKMAIEEDADTNKKNETGMNRDFIEFDEDDNNAESKNLAAVMQAYSKDTDLVLIVAFETTMEKFQNDFELGVDFLTICNEFDTQWVGSVSEKIYTELSKLVGDNDTQKLKLEWAFLGLDLPKSSKSAAKYQQNLQSFEKVLIPIIEKTTEQKKIQEVLRQWLALWISQKDLSTFYVDIVNQDYQQFAQGHFDKITDLQQIQDVLVLDRKVIDDLDLIIKRLELTSKTMKKLAKKIQAVKSGLPNEAMMLEDGESAENSSGTTDVAGLRKILKTEGGKLKPTATIHILKTIVAKDAKLWDAGSSEEILSLIKSGMHYLVKASNILEEFFQSILTEMEKNLKHKKNAGEEFRMDVYEEMLKLQNICPASVYISYVDYLLTTDDKDVKEIKRILNKGLSFHKTNKKLWLLLIQVEKEYGDALLCTNLFEKARKEIKDETFTVEYIALVSQ